MYSSLNFKGEIIKGPLIFSLHHESLLITKFNFISLLKYQYVTIAESTSAIGNDHQTPFKPKNGGKIRINGMRKKPCLVSVNNKAGIAFPMA
jgi:hypothetical protein